MSRVRVWVSIAVLLGVESAPAQPLPVPTGPPKIYQTACALAQSMTSKFPTKRMRPEQVQRTCEALVPNMGPEDRKEFMRCCIEQLLQP